MSSATSSSEPAAASAAGPAPTLASGPNSARSRPAKQSAPASSQQQDSTGAHQCAGSSLTDFSIDSIMAEGAPAARQARSGSTSSSSSSAAAASVASACDSTCASSCASSYNSALLASSASYASPAPSSPSTSCISPGLLQQPQPPDFRLKHLSEARNTFPLSHANQRPSTGASQPHFSKPKKFRPKNFRCPACKMAFSNNGQLKNHVRIHTGERPFRCNQPDCQKTFTRNEELTRHKLIHTGVRPHACASCGKRFGRKDHLKKHVRTHERKRGRKRSTPATVHATSIAGSGSGTLCATSAAVGAVVANSATHAANIQRNNSITPAGLDTHSTSRHTFMPTIEDLNALKERARHSAPDHPGQRHHLVIGAQTRPTAPTLGVATSPNLSLQPRMPPMQPAMALAGLGPHLASGVAHNIGVPQCLPGSPGAGSQAALAAGLAFGAVAPPSIQQLASDYWNKWYNNLLGFYHHQHQQQHHSHQDQQTQARHNTSEMTPSLASLFLDKKPH